MYWFARRCKAMTHFVVFQAGVWQGAVTCSILWLPDWSHFILMVAPSLCLQTFLLSHSSSQSYRNNRLPRSGGSSGRQRRCKKEQSTGAAVGPLFFSFSIAIIFCVQLTYSLHASLVLNCSYRTAMWPTCPHKDKQIYWRAKNINRSTRHNNNCSRASSIIQQHSNTPH